MIRPTFNDSNSSDIQLFQGDSFNQGTFGQKPIPLQISSTQRYTDVEQVLEFEGKSIKRARRHVIGRSKAYFCFISAVTFVSFTIDDLRMITIPKEGDVYIDVTLIAIFLFFSLDIYIQILATPTYLRSVYFWLDIGATISVLRDVEMMRIPVHECNTNYFSQLEIVFVAARLGGLSIRLFRFLRVQKPPSDSKLDRLKKEFSSRDMSSIGKQIYKTDAVAPALEDLEGKFAMEPEKSGQLSLFKCKLTDVYQNYKKTGTLRKLYRHTPTPKSVFPQESKDSELSESKISRNVVDRLNIMIVLITVAMIICSGATTQPMTIDGISSQRYGLGLIYEAEGIPRFKEMVMKYIEEHSDPGDLTILVQLSFNDTMYLGPVPSRLRASEICVVTYEDVEAVLSIKTKTRLLAIFDLGTIVLVCCLFIVTCLALSADVTNMVIFPLERMLETVNLLSKNPLSLMQLAQKSRTILISRSEKHCCEAGKDYANEELKLLEHAFRKIGIMLGLVYGTAGSEIITNSLKFDGGFSPLVPGKDVLAVFCFAKIVNFDLLVDCLGPEILKYVNLVSNLVHNVSAKYFGAVNKNLGDSYLLVWKFREEDRITMKQKSILNPQSSNVKSTVSLALLFAIKTIEKTASSELLFQYQQNKEIIQRMQGFSSKLTFGFHVGWAYEGAIGSSYKIDASYLSPNVNMASRVESATKQYGVQILVSDEVYILLEDAVQTFMRHIDTVTLKGVSAAVKLYTFDLVDSGLALSSSQPQKQRTERKRKKLKDALEMNLISVGQVFTHSETIAKMRRQYEKAFFERFKEGFRCYEAGKWREAAKTFSTYCLSMVPGDGPTKTLMAFMEENNYEAPLTWKGVRELLYK